MYKNALDNLRNVAERIRLGEYEQETLKTRSIMSRKEEAEEPREPTQEEDFKSSLLEALLTIEEFDAEEPATEEPLSAPTARPKSREDWYGETGLTDDPAFMKEVERLQEKYPGLSKSEIFRTIQGESAFNPKAQNKGTKASGLFQFIPSTAAELGYTTDEILDMAPAEQLRLYDQYLEKWGYQGGNALGIMQAAPAYANAAPNKVVYAKGSAAWKQNPGWRPNDGGDITVESINAYYRGQS